MLQRISLLFVLTVISLSLFGQENLPEISYTAKPRKYVVAAIDVVGELNNDPKFLPTFQVCVLDRKLQFLVTISQQQLRNTGITVFF